MTDLTRATALWRSGRPGEAEQLVLDALRDSPDDAAALRALAEICASTARAPEALGIWRRLARLCPADAGIQRQLAQSLLANQLAAEAIEVLRLATELEPSNARGHNNLGLAELRHGDAAAAIRSLQQAVSVDPRYALAHMNLGLAQSQSGQREAARASFERALHIDPHLSHARAQLSELLRLSDAAAARREHERALESHAINLMSVRRHDEAVPVWTQLIEGGAPLHYLEGDRFHCRLHGCDWDDYDAIAGRLAAQVLEGRPADRPFSFFVYSPSAQAQRRCAEVFIADRHPPLAAQPPAAAMRAASNRIKVAYLSFDFQEHATAYLIAGLLECHDRARFEVMALSYGPDDRSAMRERLSRSVERFVDVSRLSDREVADFMRSEGIQIAVDLKGFTGGARTGIFALRAAPVQINYLGYPGTMGASYMDYIIADRHLISGEDQAHYTEKVIYLPDSYQPNDAGRPLPARTGSRADHGLGESGFVFCCFNNVYKITPAVFAAWMQLLREVAGSILWLLEGTAAAMRNLRRQAALHGVEPLRIVFAPHIGQAEHLARYRHADLFLDTLPCNAHTTASDALWLGVPVLTVTGTTFAGRVATSLLHAVGLPQLCAPSLAEYVAKALRLAGTASELTALKAHLEHGRRQFPLFDTQRYCRHLEAAYQAAWTRQARGEAPAMLELGRLDA